MLVYHNNIGHPDITGYNFIIDRDNEIRIIDFEFAHGESCSEIDEPHMEEILGGTKKWNREFM